MVSFCLFFGVVCRWFYQSTNTFLYFFRKKYAKNRVVVGFSRHLLCSQVASDILQSLRALPLAVGRNTAGRGQLAIHETTATRHSNAQTIPRLFLVLLDCSLCSLTLPFRLWRRICFCNADTRASIDTHHSLSCRAHAGHLNVSEMLHCVQHDR